MPQRLIASAMALDGMCIQVMNCVVSVSMFLTCPIFKMSNVLLVYVLPLNHIVPKLYISSVQYAYRVPQFDVNHACTRRAPLDGSRPSNSGLGECYSQVTA